MNKEWNVHNILDVLEFLRNRKIHHTISQMRNDSVMISCSIVGARIEIDLMRDGVEYSIFSGDESVKLDIDGLRQMFLEYE